MPDDQVVNPADSTDAVAPEAQAGTVTGSVNPDGSDRPVQNAVAEFNRKFSRLESQLQNVAQLVAQSQQRTTVPESGSAPKDEELWSLAQQGDRRAFDMYMERIAERKANASMQAGEYSRLVDTQLTTLAQRYPVLNDTSHPLTQTVQTAYRIMVNQGYPQTRATLLDAMKTAIADRPDLVAELHRSQSDATTATRASASRRAQAGQTGTTTRDADTARQGNARAITPQQAQLAQRMGIKDPAKSIERFNARRDAGVSNLGAVAAAIPEDSL